MSAEALVSVVSLSGVGAPSALGQKHVEHLAAEVRAILKEFRSQGAAEEAIGVSQSHLSQLARGRKAVRGIGLDVLIKLRDHSGRSLDELLGLPPPKRKRVGTVSGIKETPLGERIGALEKEVSRMRSVLEMMATELPDPRGS